MATPNPATTEWVPLHNTNAVAGPTGPAGPQGPPGPAGSGADLTYHGAYVTPKTYNDGDIVIASDGVAYICVVDGTTTPPEPWPDSGGTVTPSAHATTHNTAGSDALTDISGGIITSGTIPDARLSGNIPRLNQDNGFGGTISASSVTAQNSLFTTGFILANGFGIGSYIQSAGPIYPGNMTDNWNIQSNWSLASHSSYGLYANTGIYSAASIYAKTGYYEFDRNVGMGIWQSYTPQMVVNSGANPVLGNGSITGTYTLIGRTVFFSTFLTWNTTSSSPGGVWGFSVPIAPAYHITGTHWIYNGVTGKTYTGNLAWGSFLVGGNCVDKTICLINTGSTNDYAPFLSVATPFSWAGTGPHYCIMNGSYQF